MSCHSFPATPVKFVGVFLFNSLGIKFIGISASLPSNKQIPQCIHTR